MTRELEIYLDLGTAIVTYDLIFKRQYDGSDDSGNKGEWVTFPEISEVEIRDLSGRVVYMDQLVSGDLMKILDRINRDAAEVDPETWREESKNSYGADILNRD